LEGEGTRETTDEQLKEGQKTLREREEGRDEVSVAWKERRNR